MGASTSRSSTARRYFSQNAMTLRLSLMPSSSASVLGMLVFEQPAAGMAVARPRARTSARIDDMGWELGTERTTGSALFREPYDSPAPRGKWESGRKQTLRSRAGPPAAYPSS